MKRSLSVLALILSVSVPAIQAGDPASAVTPLVHAHAHNDYEHTRPLFDALDHGFCSIEADIYLVDGRLLVAHDRAKVKPDRTLQSLYLDPLRARIQENSGRVYKNGPPVILLIDVKSDAEATYGVLRSVLNAYTNVLTCFTPTGVQTGALTAIVTGNRSSKVVAQDQTRYAALDGRPEDLDANASKELVPLVSEDWKVLFRWRGTGQFPEPERLRLKQFVDKAHQQGRQVRFWGTPDRPEMWRALLAAGVDWINADDLTGLQEFFRTVKNP
jgi:glycerophosphoryl diester phosphodiesterase